MLIDIKVIDASRDQLSGEEVKRVIRKTRTNSAHAVASALWEARSRRPLCLDLAEGGAPVFGPYGVSTKLVINWNIDSAEGIGG